jgi:GNAT superfamily N-acetyltransferase
MLENCLYFALCDIDSDKLIGFARAISDQIFRAAIYDVMLETKYQGKGIGRLLMDTVLNNPKMKCVERIELYTVDKAPFYEKWGFVSLNDRMTLMRKTTR